jgi:hypothetical protein
MKDEALRASGGFCAPLLPHTRSNTGISFALAAHRLTAVRRGGIDFRPPSVKWAIKRERELRALTKMWDWP